MNEDVTIYDESNVLYDGDDWLIIQPKTENSFKYFAPSVIDDYWGRFLYYQIIFVIDKELIDKNVKSATHYILYKSEGSKYYDGWGMSISEESFFQGLPQEIDMKVRSINIKPLTVYELLVKVSSGINIPFEALSLSDELISGFRFNSKVPSKSLVTLTFDDLDQFLKIFGIDDDSNDGWYLNILMNNRGYDYESSSNNIESWSEGYVLYDFNEENQQKLNDLIMLVHPVSSVSVNNNDEITDARRELYELFPEIDYIVDEWCDLTNEAKFDSEKYKVLSHFEGVTENLGIIEKSIFDEYVTTVGILISLYKQASSFNIGLLDMLTLYFEDDSHQGWCEFMYEAEAEDFNSDSFNNYVSKQFDRIYERIETEDKFTKLIEYSDLFQKISKKYPPGKVSKTEHGLEFIFETIDKSTLKIIVTVMAKNSDYFEKRSYTEEEFNNFIHYPSLLESKKK